MATDRRNVLRWEFVALAAAMAACLVFLARFTVRLNNGKWLYGQGDWADRLGPIACVVLPVLGVSTIAWAAALRARRKNRTAGRDAVCRACGYDLSGLGRLDEWVCPECGHPFDGSPPGAGDRADSI